MSIESDFSRIATALETIAQLLKAGEPSYAQPPTPPVITFAAPLVASTPGAAAPTPTPAPAPVVAAVAPVAVPTFVMQSPVGSPFADGKALLAYVMDAYKSMGPIKGAQIQNILTSIGVQNINDVKPEQYAAFHAGVEALKVA